MRRAAGEPIKAVGLMALSYERLAPKPRNHIISAILPLDFVHPHPDRRIMKSLTGRRSRSVDPTDV